MSEDAVLNFLTNIQIPEQGNKRMAEAVGWLDILQS